VSAGEFASVTRNDALFDVIAAEMAARGPITFERYMALALYHPTLGYYRSGKRRVGERGDYVTSPYLSPLFGAIVGRQLAEMWDRLDRPCPFHIVEMGAGDGRLMRDILSWAARAYPALLDAAEPILIEPDPALRAEQRRTLAHLGVKPRWHADLERLAWESITGCVISNELADSLPVRLFSVRGGTLYEIRVDRRGDALVEVEDDGPGPDVPDYAAPLIRAMPDGARVEGRREADRWMLGAASVLRRGFVLTFDYGYSAADLYAPWRRPGTLMAFYRHAVSPDALAHPGEQDLTAHVDFTALALAGRARGLEPVGFTLQREFLTALGIHEAVSEPGLPLEETLARRRAVLALTDPAGLGRVRVLAQERGVDGHDLTGFRGAPPAREALLAGIGGE